MRRGNLLFRRNRVFECYLAALWLVCLYRAITQSIVHDEALTYQLYIAAPFSRIFHYFDANHHFLSTLLMRLSVAMFGLSEWSMRLPALAAAGLYFWVVYQIGMRMFRTAAVSWLAVGLLTLNPFVVDFLVAARGYGMALALFIYALTALIWYAQAKDGGNVQPRAVLVRAGIALALSIAANLVFAVPVVALVCLAVFRLRHSAAVPTPAVASTHSKKKRRKAASGRQKPAPNPVYAYFLAPFAAIGFLLFLTMPLDVATSGNFYVGASSIPDSLKSLASASLLYGSSLLPGGSLPFEGFPRTSHFMHLSSDAVAFVVAPLILITGAIVGFRRGDVLLLFTAGTGAGSAIILVLAHMLLDVPYPIDRTGIYFLVLVPLSMAGLAGSELAPARISRIPALLLYGFGVALVLRFTLEAEVRSFLTWRYDADTRRIADRLARAQSHPAPDSVSVGASWQLEPSLNFYRDEKRLLWMRPVERGSLRPGAGYYVIGSMDRPAVSTLGLKTIYEWPLSGAVLAVPAAP